MDALSYLFCLLVGIALPTALVVGVVHRAWRQIAVAEAYRTISNELALSVDTRGVSLHGWVGGGSVYVGEVLEGHGTARRLLYRGILELERPLGLGLLLKPRASRFRRRARTRQVRLRIEALDKLFDVYGDDEDRVRALFDEGVRAALDALLRRWPDLVVSDHHVRVGLKQPIARTDDLRELVALMRSLAAALGTARERIAPPSTLDVWHPGWKALAERLGLAFDAAFPALDGEIDGRRVQLTVRREEHEHAVQLRVWFRPHRATGIRLRPQTEPDGYWSVGQDIQVGDPAFDPAFVIKGYHPGDIQDILDAEARAGLLALAAAGHVEVDDRLLRLRGAPVDPASLEPLVHLALRTAAAMW